MLDYYLLTCRYICHGCKEQAAQEKEKVAQQKERARKAAEAAGMGCEDCPPDTGPPDSAGVEAVDDDVRYTFSSCNTESLRLLPFGLGDRLKVFCTYRRAVDMVSTTVA